MVKHIPSIIRCIAICPASFIRSDLPHLLGQDLFRFLWLCMGKHLVQAVPFVYALQCLTGKVDNNNNDNKVIKLLSSWKRNGKV